MKKDLLKDTGIDGRIIIKWIFKKWNVDWINLAQDWASGGIFWTWQYYGSVEGQGCQEFYPTNSIINIKNQRIFNCNKDICIYIYILILNKYNK